MIWGRWLCILLALQPAVGIIGGLVAGYFLHRRCGVDYVCATQTFMGWFQ